jgi:microcystin-dependent protein
VSNESSTPLTIEAINGLLARIEALERQPTAWTRGDIKLWYRSVTDLPTGWHPCDGTVAPDGVTTPDLRGRVPVGLKSGDADFDTLGEVGGAKTHAHTSPQHNHDMSHSHPVSMGGPTGIDGAPGGADDVNNDSPADVSVALDYHEHEAEADTITADTALNAAENTGSTSSLPPYAVVTFAYRYV